MYNVFDALVSRIYLERYMKKLAKILVLVLVLTIVVTCLVACGEKTTIDISSDGYWVIDGVKTEHKAIGENGINGIDGDDGVTPTIEISSDGYWVINGSKTDKKAIGTDGNDGNDGATPTIEISADGYWVINGVKTEYKAFEEDENPQGLEFLPLDDGTYAVSGGKASYLSNIVIPSTHKGKAVTKIATNGFYEFDLVASITIPESVTSIDEDAFMSCGDAIVYCEAKSKPNGWGEEWNDRVAGPLFVGLPIVWDCKNNDVADDGYIYTTIDDIMYSLKDGVATIIKQLSAIASINIPASVTYKGNMYAVTSIGSGAFRNCTSLESVTFGENSQLESIGSEAFYGCTSLTSIIIPDNVTSIGSDAFRNCSSLTFIIIPNGVTGISYDTFDNCSSLTIYCEAESKPSGDEDWESGRPVYLYSETEPTGEGNYWRYVDGVPTAW